MYIFYLYLSCDSEFKKIFCFLKGKMWVNSITDSVILLILSLDVERGKRQVILTKIRREQQCRLTVALAEWSHLLRKANHIEKCSSDSLTDIVHLAVGISRAPIVIDLIGPRNTKRWGYCQNSGFWCGRICFLKDVTGSWQS